VASHSEDLRTSVHLCHRLEHTKEQRIMQWRIWKHRGIIAVAAIVTTLTVLRAEVALAHGGHSHETGGAFDATVVFEVGGVAVVLATLYLLAARTYRRLDTVNEDHVDAADQSGL
jgi:hypothetical protein